MKRLTNPIKQSILMTCMLIFFISCTEKNQPENPLLKEYEKRIETLEKENKTLKTESETRTNRKPDHIIQSDFAQKIYHLYDKREELINKIVATDGEGNDFNATRSLFYDINDLSEYLSYIKTLSKKAGVRPSGLRFYFALYPDDYVRDNKDKKYAKRQTFFIAPTREVKDAAGNIEHLGYTLDNNFKPVLLRDKIGLDRRVGINLESFDANKYQQAGFFNFNMSSFQEENSLIANEVQGSPPNNDH